MLDVAGTHLDDIRHASTTAPMTVPRAFKMNHHGLLM
jgi:hypothetical protein